jgi:hypothetical protein
MEYCEKVGRFADQHITPEKRQTVITQQAAFDSFN